MILYYVAWNHQKTKDSLVFLGEWGSFTCISGPKGKAFKIVSQFSCWIYRVKITSQRMFDSICSEI